MAKNTSVLLGDYFDTFIQEKVASGRYKSASEVVRSALRLLEKEEEKLEILRAEIQKGIDSPKSILESREDLLTKIKSRVNG